MGLLLRRRFADQENEKPLETKTGVNAVIEPEKPKKRTRKPKVEE